MALAKGQTSCGWIQGNSISPLRASTWGRSYQTNLIEKFGTRPSMTLST